MKLISKMETTRVTPSRRCLLPASKTTKRGRALQTLQDALQDLSKEERYDVLQALPSVVKTALLKHMEHGKALEATLRTNQGSAVNVGSPAKVCHRRGVFVQQKKGGWVARMTLLPYLSVTTRCASTAPEATKMLKVLQRAKMLAPRHERCEAKEVYQALSDACAEHSMTLGDLSLSFCATVGVQSLVGCSINSKYSTSLEDVLQQRHLLLQGREEGYLKLREACQKVLLTAVTPRSTGVFGRARTSCAAHTLVEAEDLLTTLDLKRRQFCQRRVKKAVSQAVKLVKVITVPRSRSSRPKKRKRHRAVMESF